MMRSNQEMQEAAKTLRSMMDVLSEIGMDEELMLTMASTLAGIEWCMGGDTRLAESTARLIDKLSAIRQQHDNRLKASRN